jgi:beta-phosphoglucomutase family hydrolase
MEYDIQHGVKGLIFDLDGTLADTTPYHFIAWNLASKKFGIDMDKAFLRKFNGSPGKVIATEIIKKYGMEDAISIEEIIKEKIRQFDKFQHEIKPIIPVTDIVRKYHGIFPMAVGTGGHRKTVIRTLETTGMKNYFDIIVTSNDVDNFKPHPETFLKCAEMMNVEPSHIEVFEDSNLGLEAARRAGMIATDVSSWYDSNW